MNCPIRKKKIRFLFWEFELKMSHEWEILDIGVHIPLVSDNYKISRKCKHCGKWQMKHFVEYEELIELGYSKETLEKALYNKI